MPAVSLSSAAPSSNPANQLGGCSHLISRHPPHNSPAATIKTPKKDAHSHEPPGDEETSVSRPDRENISAIIPATIITGYLLRLIQVIVQATHSLPNQNTSDHKPANIISARFSQV
jgi:hypothetical protein